MDSTDSKTTTKLVHEDTQREDLKQQKEMPSRQVKETNATVQRTREQEEKRRKMEEESQRNIKRSQKEENRYLIIDSPAAPPHPSPSPPPFLT